MAGFLNFLPGEEKASFVEGRTMRPEALERWKLTGLLDDCSTVPDHVVVREGMGPDKKQGLFFYCKPISGQNPPSWTYNESSQSWIESRDGTSRWIGWYHDALPVPADLLRRNSMVPSHRGTIEDGRGQHWQLITARSFPANQPVLPCTYSFDKEGKVQQTTLPKYEPIWKLSGRLVNHFAHQFSDEGDASQLESDNFLIASAAEIMGVNYRLGKTEITALDQAGVGLLTQQNVLRILYVLIDQPLLDDFSAWLDATKESDKKKDPPSNPTLNSSSVSAGSKETIETIDHQEAL